VRITAVSGAASRKWRNAKAAAETSSTPAIAHGSLETLPAPTGVSGDTASGPSSRMRASPISRSRFLTSRSRQRPTSVRSDDGVSFGSFPTSIGARSTSASVCEVVSPSNSRVPVSSSHSTTPKDQMSARLSTTLPAACSGLI